METSYKEKYEQALSKAKDMLNYKEVSKYGGHTNGVYDKDILAWLEKQKGNIGGISANWSEEDEKMLDSICISINEESIAHGLRSRGDSYSIEDLTTIRSKQINWLKSLRPQSRWKPSDEQIKVCKEVYADLLSAKGFDLGTVVSELNRLEEGLKKKGE